MINNITSTVIASVAILALPSPDAGAAIYMDVDGDIATPEAAVAVASGTPVTLRAIFAAGDPPPFAIDAVSMIMAFAGSGAATFAGVSAGAFASAGSGGLAPFSSDIVSGATGIMSGSPLTPIAVPAPGFIEAAGFDDYTGDSTFSGIGAVPGPGTPHNLMEWSFTIFGAPGDSVTFVPGPGIGGPQGGEIPVAGGGYWMFRDVAGGGFAPDVSGIKITIVPEPTVYLLVGLTGLSLVLTRRRPRRVVR